LEKLLTTAISISQTLMCLVDVKKLAEWGLLRPLGNGVYTITLQGKQYLDGELDAAKLDREDEVSA